MLLDTYDYRKSVSLITDDAAAVETRDLLVANATAPTIADAYRMALINDEMREAVFGPQYAGKNGNKALYSDDVLDELNETMAELTRPQGKVYWLLEEMGLTLCTTRVKRKATLGGGETVVVSKNGRFVTDNADVALIFNSTPDFQRAEKAVERAMYKAIEDSRRIPALAGKLPPLIGATGKNIQTHLALPVKSNGGQTP